MKKTIAYKNHFAGIVYILCTILGIVLIITDIRFIYTYYFILGVILTIIGGYLSLKYLMLPSKIISIDNNGIIYLPKGITLTKNDVIKVDYRKARAKSITYRYGTIIISTLKKDYKYHFITDCQNVHDILNDFIHDINV
jgi:hypothetical protein